MTAIDPYAVLGVPRTATRAEIARRYRELARLHHPDAGAEASERMVRINEAWAILRDPASRARWDRRNTVVEPPTWAATPAVRARRPPREPEAPPSRMDSGFTVAAIVIGVSVLVGAVMVGIVTAAGPTDSTAAFDGDGIGFEHPAEWTVAPGDEGQEASHRVLAHIVTFPVTDDELCTSFADPCPFTGEAVPRGGASVVITEWQGGTPPIRAEDRDAGDIGGEPAAFRVERFGERDFTATWQLSPPGFPDRWIEVRADIAGLQRERQRLFERIIVVLDSLQFRR